MAFGIQVLRLGFNGGSHPLKFEKARHAFEGDGLVGLAFDRNIGIENACPKCCILGVCNFPHKKITTEITPISRFAAGGICRCHEWFSRWNVPLKIRGSGHCTPRRQRHR